VERSEAAPNNMHMRPQQRVRSFFSPLNCNLTNWTIGQDHPRITVEASQKASQKYLKF